MPQIEKGTLSAGATLPQSPSSSCSQSSGSSKYCSSGAKEHATANDVLSVADALIVEESGGVLKRTFSEAELDAMNREEPKLLTRSQSHKMLGNHSSSETHHLSHMGVFKVKASYGVDKIRFSLQPSWGLRDLQQEIMKRFNIDSTCTIDLKYLDDDHEWILLTCDDDLKECKDICGSPRSHSIKISIHKASQPRLGRFIQ
uniref:PB1 domain-containing protein n=1 Tax=Rhizophora mucronata TaxID=61149 RepID=A0A2P2PW75_RHIMU